MGSLTRPGLQQGQLVWNPEMEEAGDRPPSMILIDKYFAVYRKRRRMLISGEAPPGLGGNRPLQARAWRAYQHRMSEESAWERAERYRQMMQTRSCQSIRALARAIGEDHSRVARILKVLDLPKPLLTALQAHADHGRIRAYFTEKRLTQLVKQVPDEATILREVEQVLQGST